MPSSAPGAESARVLRTARKLRETSPVNNARAAFARSGKSGKSGKSGVVARGRAGALLAASVVAVPVFKRIGLVSVLGYLSAGLAIEPFGLGSFSDPQSILHVAELGVVLFLFVIGLEMQPSRLWSLRKEILGLGAVARVLGRLRSGGSPLVNARSARRRARLRRARGLRR